MMLVSVMLFTGIALQAQVLGNFCHNKGSQLYCTSWLNYVLKFDNNKFKTFYTIDSSINYNSDSKRIQVIIPNDTMIIELKGTGVSLTTVRDNNVVFLPISDSESICDNEDHENLIRLNKIGNLGILPIIREKCKIKGLQLPIVKNNSISIFFFRGIDNKELFWDIIVNGLKGNYQDYNQVKLFTNEYDGQISSINLCFKNGGAADYKNVDPGTEISYNPNKSNIVTWKIRSVVETKLKDYVAFADLIEYDKKGKVKSAKMPVEQCFCKQQ